MKKRSGVNLACMMNDELVARLVGSLRLERRGLAEFLRVLAEVEARKIHVQRGFSSLFAYCTKGLGLSEDQAYRRVVVARAGRRFPLVLQMIADGAVHLSGVAKLAKHLTEENHLELLEKARGKTKAEVEVMIAAAFPKPDVPPSVRKIPAPRPAEPVTAEPPAARPSPASCQDSKPREEPDAPRPPAPPVPKPPANKRPEITPTSAEAYAVRFTASAHAKVLLERARDLLGPQGPADIGQILELGLEALVQKLEKDKRAKTDRPRKTPKAEDPAPGDRYVPAEVRRLVYERDGDRCTYVAPDGRRCNCTFGLQLDHIKPVALGGTSTPDNLRVRCRAHNIHAAEQIFGREKMDRHRTKSPGPAQVQGPHPCDPGPHEARLDGA